MDTTTQIGTTDKYYRALEDPYNWQIEIDGTRYWVYRNTAVRGYTSQMYSLDRWFLGDIWTSGNGALSINDGYITLQEGIFQQIKLKRSRMNGRVLSVSVLYADGTLGYGVIHLPDEIVIGTSYTDGVTANHGVVRYISEDILEYRVESNGGQYVAVKLEFGDTQTLAHQDANGNWILNEIPNKAEQLAICSNYDPTTGEFKNTTFAPSNHTQSASTITAGTFAGKVYANPSAIADITDYQVRNIATHSVDITAGAAPLSDGYIYLVYE